MADLVTTFFRGFNVKVPKQDVPQPAGDHVQKADEGSFYAGRPLLCRSSFLATILEEGNRNVGLDLTKGSLRGRNMENRFQV